MLLIKMGQIKRIRQKLPACLVFFLFSLSVPQTASAASDPDDSLFRPNFVDRSRFTEDIKEARSFRREANTAAQQQAITKSIALYESAVRLYRKLGINMKTTVWDRPAVIEYSDCLREMGNALILAGRTEEAVYSWSEADNNYCHGGIISAFPIELNPESDLALQKQCLDGQRLTSANLQLFMTQIAGVGSADSSSRVNEHDGADATFFLPYNHCGVFRIESIKQRQLNWWNAPTIKGLAQQEEILREDYHPQVINMQLGFTLPVRDSVFLRRVPINSLMGKRIVLCYGPGGRTDSPFPDQVFTEAELKVLKEQLVKDDHLQHNLESEMQHYFESRWTVRRIKDFCRPETRSSGGRVGLLLRNQNETSYSKVLKGQLYPEMEDKIGKVLWYCETARVLDGPLRPARYAVVVQRGKDHWNLEINLPALRQWVDDDFTKHRLRMTLLTCLDASRLIAPNKNHICAQDESDINDEIIHRTLALGNAYSETIKFEGGVGHYTCTLADEKSLDILLDENQAIKSIFKDGKPDDVWNEAYGKVNKNIDCIMEITKTPEASRRIEDNFQNAK